MLIAGGGIGGLTAALALSRAGIASRVFERAPELHEVGAGLGLWSNALRVLDRLGVGAEVRGAGTPLQVAEICTARGEVLSRVDIARAIDDPDGANFIVHRAELHGILTRALPAGILETGSELTGCTQDADGVNVSLRDGRSARGRLLVGADGLRSRVRRELWGEETLRYSGQTCYRGIAEIAPPDEGVIREIQGVGMRAAVCPMGGGRVYWWAALNAPLGREDAVESRLDFLLHRFRGWPFHLPDVIAATRGEVLRNDLLDRPVRTQWGRGRISLLGDAAHPMLPNLGQGACSAIEDGLVLARAVVTHGPSARALRAYESERVGRTSGLVRQSWNFGVMARWEQSWAVRMREAVLRAIPGRLVAQQIRAQVGFDAGPLPVASAAPGSRGTPGPR